MVLLEAAHELGSKHFVEIAYFVVISLVTYQLFIYPLFLNPLNQIPGPSIYKITSIPSLNDQRTEARNQKLDVWHKKYGSVVQISPNEISLSSAKHLKEIYVKKNLPKTSFYKQFSNFGEYNAFSTLDTSVHIKRKKLMTKIYTKTAVFNESSQLHINKKVNNAVKFIEERLERPMDVYELFNSLAMDVVTFYEFGSKFSTDLISDLNQRDIIKSFRASSSMWFYTTLLPQLWSWAATKETAERSDQSRIWTESIFLKAYEALENNETPQELSLIRILYDLGLSKWSIGSELFDHVAAGHETTGTSLAYATWELSRPSNLFMQDKIHEELNENFQELGDFVELEKIDKLIYLDAFISELTRLHAAIPGSEPREVSSDNHYEIELANGVKVKLPKGTIVSVQPWTIHRDPTVFSYPDEFRPERWLKQDDETPEEFKKRYQNMKSMMFAFGQGNRMCLGMNIAIIEMKLCIAKLYWSYTSKISSNWCKSKEFKDGGVLMGFCNLKGKKKEELNDVELMTMADSYTSRPIFDECWLEWNKR